MVRPIDLGGGSGHQGESPFLANYWGQCPKGRIQATMVLKRISEDLLLTIWWAEDAQVPSWEAWKETKGTNTLY